MAKHTAEGNSPRLAFSDWLSMAAVISLLGVVGVPAFLTARDAVADSACDANRLLLVAAIQRYHHEDGALVHSGGPTNLLIRQILKRGYLHSEPREPASGQKYQIYIEKSNSPPEAPAGKILVHVDCPNSDHFHGSDSASLINRPKAL